MGEQGDYIYGGSLGQFSHGWAIPFSYVSAVRLSNAIQKSDHLVSNLLLTNQIPDPSGIRIAYEHILLYSIIF